MEIQRWGKDSPANFLPSKLQLKPQDQGQGKKNKKQNKIATTSLPISHLGEKGLQTIMTPQFQTFAHQFLIAGTLRQTLPLPPVIKEAGSTKPTLMMQHLGGGAELHPTPAHTQAGRTPKEEKKTAEGQGAEHILARDIDTPSSSHSLAFLWPTPSPSPHSLTLFQLQGNQIDGSIHLHVSTDSIIRRRAGPEFHPLAAQQISYLSRQHCFSRKPASNRSNKCKTRKMAMHLSKND